MAANVELWMRFDDTYQPALSIPVNECQRFSVHPLTWLRYVGFTIYGSEGYISVPGGPEVDYYQTTIQPGLYHYVSQESFLLDPDLMHDRASDASDVSSSQGDFGKRVVARDGLCVMTGSPYVQACHVVPHAKGHEYIINLASHRHEVLDPPLEDINDPRNGILLGYQRHGPFGASEAAFLQTPNFAMTVNDVDLVMQPNAAVLGFTIQPSAAPSRLTFQHFVDRDPITALVAPHNSDARQSVSDEWPPPLIFDVAYGCAALNTWGVPAFMNFARTRTRHIYYNGGDSGGGGPSGGGQGAKHFQQMTDRDARPAERAQDRGQQASSTADTEAPDIADMVLSLWMHNARKVQPQVHAMKAGRTRESVGTWLAE